MKKKQNKTKNEQTNSPLRGGEKTGSGGGEGEVWRAEERGSVALFKIEWEKLYWQKRQEGCVCVCVCVCVCSCSWCGSEPGRWRLLRPLVEEVLADPCFLRGDWLGWSVSAFPIKSSTASPPPHCLCVCVCLCVCEIHVRLLLHVCKPCREIGSFLCS